MDRLAEPAEDADQGEAAIALRRHQRRAIITLSQAARTADRVSVMCASCGGAQHVGGDGPPLFVFSIFVFEDRVVGRAMILDDYSNLLEHVGLVAGAAKTAPAGHHRLSPVVVRAGDGQADGHHPVGKGDGILQFQDGDVVVPCFAAVAGVASEVRYSDQLLSIFAVPVVVANPGVEGSGLWIAIAVGGSDDTGGAEQGAVAPGLIKLTVDEPNLPGELAVLRLPPGNREPSFPAQPAPAVTERWRNLFWGWDNIPAATAAGGEPGAETQQQQGGHHVGEGVSGLTSSSGGAGAT